MNNLRDAFVERNEMFEMFEERSVCYLQFLVSSICGSAWDGNQARGKDCELYLPDIYTGGQCPMLKRHSNSKYPTKPSKLSIQDLSVNFPFSSTIVS